jgi:competence protein ComEA
MKKPWWLASFIVVGVLLGTGVLLLVTRPPRGKPIVLLGPPTPAPVTVYVDGAVNSAGLYRLPSGSRITDAIQAAGGFIDGANTSLLNLAKILQDGERINVPELASPVATNDQNNVTNPTTGLVDINSATLEQLDTLPDIGPITAQAIIDYRNANGPFSKPEDIIDVSGIGQATFDKIKDLISVGIVSP